MALPIEDYALIGDCKSAALVGRDGPIDWLAWSRFDSAACFAALLGTLGNGRWLIAPTASPRPPAGIEEFRLGVPAFYIRPRGERLPRWAADAAAVSLLHSSPSWASVPIPVITEIGSSAGIV
jgi:Domain of unknown function (DUF5911)